MADDEDDDDEHEHHRDGVIATLVWRYRIVTLSRFSVDKIIDQNKCCHKSATVWIPLLLKAYYVTQEILTPNIAIKKLDFLATDSIRQGKLLKRFNSCYVF